MKINVPNNTTTHEGAPAQALNPYARLKRTVMACLLFEDQFYEDGMSVADRIKDLCSKCSCVQVLTLAVEAAQKYHLRHVPLQMVVEALKLPQKPESFANTICSLINRPDQMTDLLALYWKDGRKPLANQLKKGLAKAFTKFDEYQLSKYNRDNPIKLRDVLFLCHAKPKDEEQGELWKRLVNKTLKTADTWETRLSAGADKKQSFQEMLAEHKLGKLAILRNLRNMHETGVPKDLVKEELSRNMKEMFPFQYLAAARECPQWEDIIDPAMIASCALKPKLMGTTIILVDVSGSMDNIMAGKSKTLRLDAACGLAILLRECCEDFNIFSFSDKLMPIPPRQGMALRDAIISSQPHGATYLGGALRMVNPGLRPNMRVIVITDEQSADAIPFMNSRKNYILNIGSYENGIGNSKKWTTISGFAEASIDFIRELEVSAD